MTKHALNIAGLTVSALALLGAGCTNSSTTAVPGSSSGNPSSTPSTTVMVPTALKPQNPPSELAMTDKTTYGFTNAAEEWGTSTWFATFPTSAMKGTNLQGAAISTYVVRGSCDQGPETDVTDAFKKDVPPTIASSLDPAAPDWQAQQWSGAAAGTRVDTFVYRMADASNCYRVALDLWSTNRDNYPAATRPKAYSPSHYIDVLKEVVMNARPE